MSGAGKHLEQLLFKIKDEITKVDEEIYPKFVQTQRFEREWSRMLNRQNRKQKTDLNQNGYTFINKQQAKRMFSDDKSKQFVYLNLKVFVF